MESYEKKWHELVSAALMAIGGNSVDNADQVKVALETSYEMLCPEGDEFTKTVMEEFINYMYSSPWHSDTDENIAKRSYYITLAEIQVKQRREDQANE